MRQLTVLFLLGALVVPRVSPARDNKESTAPVRSLLSAAAGIPNKQFQKLATAPTGPKFSEQDNQPLSLLFLMIDFTQVHAARGQLERDYRITTPNGRFPRPSDIVGVMSRTSAFGYVSVINAQTVRKVTCEIDGDTATGRVEFEIQDAFAGRVEYRAAKQDSKWRIEEFSLPNWKTKTVRQKDGSWKATGPIVDAVRVSLPVVKHGWETIPVDRKQRVLTISHTRPDAEEAAGNGADTLQVNNRPVKLDGLAESLRKAIPETKQREATTCVLRCDRSVTVASLVKTAKEVQRAGFTKLAVGVVDKDSTSSVELPLPSLERPVNRADDIVFPDIRVDLVANADGNTSVKLGQRNLGSDQKRFDRLSGEMLKITGPLANALVEDLTVVLAFDESVQVGDLASAISACLGRVKDGKLHRFVGGFRFHMAGVKQE